MTMRREAFYRGVSTGRGRRSVVDTAQNTAQACAGRLRFKDRRLRTAHRPLPTSPSRKSTPHYTIGYSTPAGGGGGELLYYCKGRGQRRVGRGSSMHKEALGGFNQSLATKGRPGAWAEAF